MIRNNRSLQLILPWRQLLVWRLWLCLFIFDVFDFGIGGNGLIIIKFIKLRKRQILIVIIILLIFKMVLLRALAILMQNWLIDLTIKFILIHILTQNTILKTWRQAPNKARLRGSIPPVLNLIL